MPTLRKRLAAARSGRTKPVRPLRPRFGATASRAAHPHRRHQPPSAAAVKSDWRATAAAIGGIASVLLVGAGLFYTNDANRKQQQLGLDQQQLALQGQVADRFSAAIDHLGQEDEKNNDKLSIRLGGIYALQRLMIDSPPDQPGVIQVLCAFVRTHAVRPDPLPHPVPPSAADVRAAVVVLAGRPDPGSYQLDFSTTLLGLDHGKLRDAALGETELPNANLSGAYLARADMHTTDLSHADLSDADLSDADLSGADLSGANLSGANLDRANLTEADLTGVNPSHVRLTGADLSGTDMHGWDLHDQYLSRGVFNNANLRGVDLTNTDLDFADLTGADLTGANLRGLSRK